MVHGVKSLLKVNENTQAVLTVFPCITDVFHHVKNSHVSGMPSPETILTTKDMALLIKETQKTSLNHSFKDFGEDR